VSLNILIVDDSETTRAVIGKTLGIAGVPVNQVFEASNGEEALKLLEDNWVDVVFSDINMPVMGGVEMIERMYENGLLKTIPVIIVSTEGNSSRIEQLKERGISAYLRKPFTPESISRVITDILGVKEDG
jgi:two-component system chemotaxis response regulator CheY